MRRRSEYFSEVAIIFLMYHVFCFTDFVPEVETRFLVGYSISGFVILYLAVFLGSVIVISVVEMRQGFLRGQFIKRALKTQEMREGTEPLKSLRKVASTRYTAMRSAFERAKEL